MTSVRRPNRRGRLGFAGLLGIALGLAAVELSWRLEAQAPKPPLSFTGAQSDRGQALYTDHCVSCHGQNLDDGPFAPPLKGVDFRQKWDGPSVEPLFTFTSSKMPPDRPGTLGDDGYAQLLAYILHENGTRPGTNELPARPEALSAMAAPDWPRPGGGGLASGAALPAAPPRINPLDKIRPVTDAMLIHPPDGEWLLWRRTYDAFGFSPLKKINKSNVSDLRVAWTWSLPNGPNESTPIVHDGVMFIHSYGDRLQALDAATGDLLWQYSRRLPSGVQPSVKRGISIYGTRIYLPTSDVHVVALDAKTGRVVWDRMVGDPALGSRIGLFTGQQLTGGPLVAKGKVMMGTTGRLEGGNYVVALDPDTGQEAWRFYTIARPNEPGGNSWNGLPVEKRNGGSVWIPGSYDPVNHLAIFGTGNTYDTGPLRVRQDGLTNEALYLDTTLALNPDTGKLVWHFQHQTNGQWDLDWAFERQVMQLSVNNVMKSVVVTAGKQMIWDILETSTGQYVASIDVGREWGLQNVVTGIDPKSGAKLVDANLVPGDGQTKMICPHVDGGRDWMPTSYDPATKILYIPIVEACMDLVPVGEGERGNLTTGVRWKVRPKPGSDGKYGHLEAVNLETKRTVWVDRQRAPITSGVLATAGGLVFVGGIDRMFRAHDATTGAELWKIRLNDVPASVPMAYSVNGHEYIATVVGPGGSQSRAYTALVPEMEGPPDHGAAVWVFEMPTKAPSRTTP
jgi:PQQ-dependent dehydrogenase (methanol/ethanol family)